MLRFCEPNMLPRKVFESCKCNGDRWIKVGSRYVARGCYHDHHCETGGGGQAQHGFWVLCLLVHNGYCCAREDEYECAYELSPHLWFWHANFNISMFLMQIWLLISFWGRNSDSFIYIYQLKFEVWDRKMIIWLIKLINNILKTKEWEMKAKEYIYTTYKILKIKRISDKWKRSTLVSISKNKWNI